MFSIEVITQKVVILQFSACGVFAERYCNFQVCIRSGPRIDFMEFSKQGLHVFSYKYTSRRSEARQITWLTWSQFAFSADSVQKSPCSLQIQILSFSTVIPTNILLSPNFFIVPEQPLISRRYCRGSRNWANSIFDYRYPSSSLPITANDLHGFHWCGVSVISFRLPFCSLPPAPNPTANHHAGNVQLKKEITCQLPTPT
jgi:hypothetical protein